VEKRIISVIRQYFISFFVINIDLNKNYLDCIIIALKRFIFVAASHT
jgi:hypothetical protein